KAALVLCEKPAHFTGAAMRLDQESAGVKRRQRGVECNPRPMPRKYCQTMIRRFTVLDGDLIGRDRDRFRHHPRAHGGAYRPPQEQRFEHRKREYRPKAEHESEE